MNGEVLSGQVNGVGLGVGVSVGVGVGVGVLVAVGVGVGADIVSVLDSLEIDRSHNDP